VPFYKPLLYQDEKRPGIPWGPQVGGWVFGFGCDVCMAWDSYSIRYTVREPVHTTHLEISDKHG